ncbi:MAG TPA: bifunctional helix-turn-helix transcriptional regulator/GNAT family N-acetyltransferase [Ignavibacteriaceae bacterium]|nr:bifunctional helix-turn-helix transcriptional regulator/GNAT family N-acetyltransferase [Ignavibacteriaceae bacterium]
MRTLINLGGAGINHRLKRLTESLSGDILKTYRELIPGIEPALFPVLFSLHLNGESSVQEISTSIGISHPAAVQFLKKLESKNLIHSSPDIIDQRKRIVSLTKDGEKLIKEIKPIQEDIESAVLNLQDETGINLSSELEKIESALRKNSFQSRIKLAYKERAIKEVEILSYNKGYKDIFRDLNYEWLNKYFEAEPEDEKILNDPEKEIIKKGGQIFFARINGKIVGTCAAIKKDKTTYELAKMAVTEKAKGRQAGKKLALAIIGFSWSKKAKYITLETSSKLSAAVNLYKSLGFVTVPGTESTKYKRKVFNMVLEL